MFNIPVPVRKSAFNQLCEFSYSPVWLSWDRCIGEFFSQLVSFPLFPRQKKKKMRQSEGYNRPINNLHVTKLSCLMAFCHSSCQSKPEVVKVMNEWRLVMMFERRTNLFSPFSSGKSAFPLKLPDRYLVLLSLFLFKKKWRKKRQQKLRLRFGSLLSSPRRYFVYLAKLRWVSVSECWQVGC